MSDIESKGSESERAVEAEIPMHVARVVERITDGFVMLDHNDCYLYVNGQGERILRKSRKELLGKNVWQVFPDTVNSALHKAVDEARSSAQSAKCRDFIPSYGIWVESNLYATPEGLLCYFRDVTAEQQALERSASLLKLTTALATAFTTDDVASVIIGEALPAVDAAACSVYLLSEDRAMLHVLGIVGYDEQFMNTWQHVPIDASLPLAGAVRTAEPIFLATFEDRSRQYPDMVDHSPAGAYGALAAIPLVLNNRAIGVLGLRFTNERMFTVDDREFMLTLAGQCALALERARLYDSERRLRDEEHLHYLRSSRIEQALILSEERFRFAIEAADIGIWHYNFITNDRVWSDRCREIVGLARDADLSYDIFLSLIHPEDRDRVDRGFRHAISTRTTYEEEFRVVWPSGSTHWVYAKGRGYYDASGQPIRYEGIVFGIDERKRIEAALRDSEAQLRLALTSGRLGAWHLDLVNETFVHISDTCKANFGVPADARFEYGDLFASIHPDDRARVRAALDHALRMRVDYDAEYRCLWPDGSVHWIFAHGRPTFDGEGRPHRMIGVTQDITERKRTESELTTLYAREHRIAATLQRSLVMMPQTGDLPLDVVSLYEPASDEADVGGDFMDAFAIPDGRVALVVGDVVGKGLKAASRTAEIKYTLRAFLHLRPDTATAVTMLNTFLCQAHRTDDVDADMLAALALAIIDPATGRVEVTLAGLEPPLIVRADGTAVETDTRGLPLCVDDKAVYETSTETLGAGDLLVIVSDGVTEARSGKEFLGYEGLMRLAQKADRRAPLAPIGFGILEGAKSFAGGMLHDDACLLLARRL
jgi:PAS domain S-box-containing protein